MVHYKKINTAINSEEYGYKFQFGKLRALLFKSFSSSEKEGVLSNNEQQINNKKSACSTCYVENFQ